MHNRAFSDLVLKLMQSAFDARPEQHQAQMVGLLGDLFRFDAAWWGWSSFTRGRIVFAQSSLHGLPAHYETALRMVATHDPLIRHGRDLPIYATTLDPETAPVNEAFRRFARSFGLTSMLNGHCQLQHASAYNFFMSLYRKDGGPGFTSQDAEAFRLILRHLEQSLSVSLRIDLRDRVGRSGEAALFDDAVQVVRATRGFSAALEAEGLSFAASDPVLRRVVQDGAFWQGRTRTLRAEPYGRGLMLVRADPQTGWDELAAQERKVAQRLVEGMSGPEIAQDLGVSFNTVRNQIASVYRKLGVRNRAALAAKLPRQA